MNTSKHVMIKMLQKESKGRKMWKALAMGMNHLAH